MNYNWVSFKQDVQIGAVRAVRDFFFPVVAFCRWAMRYGNAAAERNVREAREHLAPR